MMMANRHDLQIGPDDLQGSLALNPINLGVRFLLEVFALVALGAWGASLADGFLSLVLMLLFPSIGAAAWVTFNVPGDRSRSGSAPVPVSGIIRLVVEAVFFGLITVIHYLASFARIVWLVRR